MKKFILNLIKIYQKTISPNYGFKIYGNFIGCRFYPTCSEYAKEAITKYGILKGGIKAIFRVLKCGPWNKGGIDFVK